MGIIIAIILIIIGLGTIYYISFKPSVETTAISTITQSQANSVAQKFNPQNIAKNAVNIGNGKKQVSLNSQDLSNAVAYAISKEPSISKYITGIKVQPEKDNKIAVYTTGNLKGVSSQAKLNFQVANNNGKVGFIPIINIYLMVYNPVKNYIR